MQRKLFGVTILIVAGGIILINLFNKRYPKYFHVKKNQLSDEIFEKQCFHRSFAGVLLLINFNFPYYNNIELLNDLYGGVFDKIITCGPPSAMQRSAAKPDLYIGEKYGHRSYKCMELAMERYPGFEGYMFINDDMIVNWWTMAKENRSLIWHGTEVVDFQQGAFDKKIRKSWIWWNEDMGLKACQAYYSTLKSLAQNQSKTVDYKHLLNTYIENGNGKPRCGKGWADFYYIPSRFREEFIELSKIAFTTNLFHEIAVHNILQTLDLTPHINVLDGLYMPDVGKYDYKAKHFWKFYNHHLAFVHPFKFHGKDRYRSLRLFKDKVLRFKDGLIAC